MARCGQAFKDNAVARLSPPQSAPIEVVARELSISPATLERWRAQALSTPTRPHTWTAAARFDAVLMTAALDETAKSAWCREHGLYPQKLEKWRLSAMQALAAHQSRTVNDFSIYITATKRAKPLRQTMPDFIRGRCTIYL